MPSELRHTDSIQKFRLTLKTYLSNTFISDDEYYLQTNDTAMGIKMAPEYANIFMEYVENSFLSSFPLNPTVFYRYIDDIFMILSHGMDKFNFF